jgi:hypothetical protein
MNPFGLKAELSVVDAAFIVVMPLFNFPSRKI